MILAAAVLAIVGPIRSVVLQGSATISPYQPAASVAIIMVTGRAENAGCAGNIVYTGRFIVSVHSTTGNHETDLNALLGVSTLTFPEHSYWHLSTIMFGDYNRDGQPDFSLAEDYCGNVGRYWLLTITPDGSVRKLSVVPDDMLMISDGGSPSSSSIDLTSDGIQVSAYDNAVGKSFSTRYRWDQDRRAFILTSPRPTGGK